SSPYRSSRDHGLLNVRGTLAKPARGGKLFGRGVPGFKLEPGRKLLKYRQMRLVAGGCSGGGSARSTGIRLSASSTMVNRLVALRRAKPRSTTASISASSGCQ